MISRKVDKWAFVVVAVAFLLRAFYCFMFWRSPLANYFRTDQVYYREWAQEIAGGAWIGKEVFEQGPLYAYFLGGIYRVFGSSDVVAIGLQLLLSVLTCLLVYLNAQRLFDRPTAVVAGMTAALYGPMLFYDGMLMKTFLSPLLTMTSLYATLRFGDACKRRWLVLSGVSIGLACLVAENHILLLVPVVVWLWTCPTSPEKSRVVRGRQSAILAAAAVFAVLPATIRNYYVAGEWVPVTANGGEMFYMGHGPYATGMFAPPPFEVAQPGREHEDFRREARRRVSRDLTRAECSRYWYGEGLREIVKRPVRAVQLTTAKIRFLVNDFEIPDNQSYSASRRYLPFLYLLPSLGWIIGFGFLGTVFCLTELRRHQLVVGFLAAHVLGVVLIYVTGRYRVGMTSIMILLAAYGLTMAVRTWRESGWMSRQGRLYLIILAIATCVGFWPLRGNLGAVSQDIDYEMAVQAGDLSRAEMIARKKLAWMKTKAEASSAEPAQWNRAIASAHMRLARLRFIQGQPGRAKDELEAARQLAPNDHEPHLLLGDIAFREGKVDEATQYLQRALELDSSLPQAHYGLAMIDIEKENLVDAVAHLERAVAMKANYVEAYVTLGDTLLRQHKLEDALRHYDAVLRLKPDYPRIREKIRLVHEGLRQSR